MGSWKRLFQTVSLTRPRPEQSAAVFFWRNVLKNMGFANTPRCPPGPEIRNANKVWLAAPRLHGLGPPPRSPVPSSPPVPPFSNPPSSIPSIPAAGASSSAIPAVPPGCRPCHPLLPAAPSSTRNSPLVFWCGFFFFLSLYFFVTSTPGLCGGEGVLQPVAGAGWQTGSAEGAETPTLPKTKPGWCSWCSANGPGRSVSHRLWP